MELPTIHRRVAAPHSGLVAMRAPAILALIPACALLVACAADPVHYRTSYDTAYAVAPQRVEYGTVEAIEMTRDGDSRPTGLGAVLGGVAGGILGHQIGSGSGNTAATIAGALGGAYVGNEVERSNGRERYRILVRLDGGGTVAMHEVGEGQLRVGDRVRVVGERIYRD
jgi:outer membrane lipoprotein SlyB